MKRLKWTKLGEVWHLYDDVTLVAVIYPYMDKTNGNINTLFSGNFKTKDDCVIELNSAGTTLQQAKERIQDNYLLDRSYEWWMR